MSVAPSVTLSGVSLAFATILELLVMKAEVSICTSVTARVPPAVPPDPSAVLERLSVVVAFSATAPETAILLAPCTAVVASPVSTSTVTAASEVESVSEPSAASSNDAVTLTLASASRLAAVRLVPSKITPAFGRIVRRLASTVLPRLEGVAKIFAVAVAESVTSPVAVIVAPVKLISASGIAI